MFKTWPCNSKISNFDYFTLGQKDILRLQITVHNILHVKVLKLKIVNS